MSWLSAEQIRALQNIDTPTVCNAIETFNVRDRIDGFLGMDIRCLFPEFGPMVGYALTVTVDSTTPEMPRDEQVWREWVLAMQAAPKPIVLVFKDVGPQPRKSAHMGEVMATLAHKLGAVGLVTDGGVRDILEVKRLGFHYFAAGVVPSHGNPRLLAVKEPVTLDGVRIQSGDLLHGDINGVTTVPLDIASQIADTAQDIRDEENGLMGFINSPEFTIEGFFKLKFKH